MNGGHSRRNKAAFSNFSSVVGRCFITGRGRGDLLGSARHDPDSNLD